MEVLWDLLAQRQDAHELCKVNNKYSSMRQKVKVIITVSEKEVIRQGRRVDKLYSKVKPIVSVGRESTTGSFITK